MIHVEFDISILALQAIGAGLALLLAILLAVLVRRRRRKARLMSAMADIRYDFIPQGDHPVIEEFRREVDASHRRYELRLLEEEWKRDGSVMLERRTGK